MYSHSLLLVNRPIIGARNKSEGDLKLYPSSVYLFRNQVSLPFSRVIHSGWVRIVSYEIGGVIVRNNGGG